VGKNFRWCTRLGCVRTLSHTQIGHRQVGLSCRAAWSVKLRSFMASLSSASPSNKGVLEVWIGQ